MFDKTEQEIMKNWQGDVSKPVVSVCTITYNHEKYIAEALDSFLMQETDFPFEVVIDDDYSNDETSKIIQKYVDEFPNIIKANLRHKNVGVIENLINNYQRAKGAYIAICEGDDCWIVSNKLQIQKDFLDKHPDYSMCIHNAIKNNLYDNSKSEFNSKVLPSTLNTKDVILRPWFSPTASFFFRKLSIVSHLKNNMNGDILLLFLNSLHGKIYYLHKTMSVYNYGTLGSMSAKTHNSKQLLYKKKINYLNYINEITNNKYGIYIKFMLLKIRIAAYLNKVGLR